MTAEVAIMNKHAIALAADSAVTMTDKKIFTSADKLFALSRYHPIGIMVYGSAIFMGVPWETIIKIYRNKLAMKKFDTLDQYASDFIKFLDDGNPLFPDSDQEAYFYSSVYGYFNLIKNEITKQLQTKIKEKGEISEAEIMQVATEIIKYHYEEWQKAKNIPSIRKNFNEKLMAKYRKRINEAIAQVFEKLPIQKKHLTQLKRIAVSLFSKFPKDIHREDISGVVIAGFGEKDTFPSLKSFFLEGIAANKLKFKLLISSKIDFNTSASIMPFAQGEMVATFMEGSDPFYREVEKNYLSQMLKEYARIISENLEKYSDREKTELKERFIKDGNKILDEYRKKLLDYI